MPHPDFPPPNGVPEPVQGASEAFNPFRLLDVETLEPTTLDRYAVFLVGLRQTLRGALRNGGRQEAMLQDFLTEVEEALADALAARRKG